MSRAHMLWKIRPWKRCRYRFASHESFYFEHFHTFNLLYCVAIVMDLSVLPLINYVCRLAHLYSFHKMYTVLL